MSKKIRFKGKLVNRDYKNKKIHGKFSFWCKIILAEIFYRKEDCHEFTK